MKKLLYILIFVPLSLFGQADVPCYSINDSVISIPILNYVSWSDSGMIVNFAENQDDNFSHIEVWQQPEDGISYWMAADLNIDTLSPNYFVHENGSPGLSASTFVNNYYIQQSDSCGYESDTSINHSSILLQANSYDYQRIQISWTKYKGWDYAIYNQNIISNPVDITYEVYRSENNIDFELIYTTIDLDQTIDESLSFVDTDLCYLNYTYYVLAKHPEIGEFQSRSNKVSLEPMFVDFNHPPKLSYSAVNFFGTLTVNGQVIEDYIVTKWEEWDQSDMNYYKIDRYDAYYGWQEEVAIMNDSVFLDFDVDVYNNEYLYRVSYNDFCGNSSPESNFGSNILLQGYQDEDYYFSWNPYIGWETGVKNYVIECYSNQNFHTLDTLPGSSIDYTTEYTSDSVSCFRVKAISYLNYISTSNLYCLEIIEGCTDINACNYNIDAEQDNGSCTFAQPYYNCDEICVNDIDGDSVCDELEILGCGDSTALNYNEFATEYDNTCIYYPNCQNLIFPPGWSMFSSYIIAESMNISNILAPISESVIISKNNLGQVYLTEFNFNGIGNLIIGHGYQIKTEGFCQIDLCGSYAFPEENPIELSSGWNMIGYLDIEPTSCEIVLDELNNSGNLIILKNYLGAAYLPEFNFNGIGFMMPGQGYQIKILENDILQY